MEFTVVLSQAEADALFIMHGDVTRHIQQLAEAAAEEAIQHLHNRRRREIEGTARDANPLTDDLVIAHYRSP